MPVIVEYSQAGITPADYEELKRTVGWAESNPPGALFHVVAFDGGQIKVIDLWERQSDYEAYVRDRLNPACEAIGLQPEPPRIIPAYAVSAYRPLQKYALGSGAT